VAGVSSLADADAVGGAGDCSGVLSVPGVLGVTGALAASPLTLPGLAPASLLADRRECGSTLILPMLFSMSARDGEVVVALAGLFAPRATRWRSCSHCSWVRLLS